MANDLQRQYYEMLMESQFWTPEQMLTHQRTQMAHLLRHARAQSPFYEHRLDAVFRPNGDIDWDRWGEIPILKRSELIEHYEEVTARAVPAGHGPVGEITTSGTTGTPLTVKVTRLSMLASDAARWRSNAWHGIDWSSVLYVRYGEDAAAVPPNGKVGGAWGPPWDAGALQGKTFRLNRQVSPAGQLGFIAGIGARYAAIGSPKNGHSLAVEALRLGVDVQFEAIFVNGEAVDELDRSVCRQAFGAKVIDLYSSKEGTHMAHRCPVSGKFHINAENLLVEIVDDIGRPCRPGETGRVVITPFYGTAQPLIRYAQGDSAVVGEPCSCGRSLPTIERLLGRVVHMFRHPDGRAVARGFPETFRAILKCSFWQFAQIGPTAFEIRYVPQDWNEVGDETAIADAFRKWYFDDAAVSFRRVDSIPLAASGKFLEYVHEVPTIVPRS